MSNRATIHLDEELHRALRQKAADVNRSVSELVNEAARQSFAEDFEDQSAFAASVSEPDFSFESVVRDLRGDGKI